MPTSTDYRAAAARFRTLARDLTVDGTARATWPGVPAVAAGPARRPIDAGLDDVRVHLARAVAHLALLAGECDRRAGVCEAHRRAWIHHWSLPAPVRLVTAPPRPPASWVDP